MPNFTFALPNHVFVYLLCVRVEPEGESITIAFFTSTFIRPWDISVSPKYSSLVCLAHGNCMGFASASLDERFELII